MSNRYFNQFRLALEKQVVDIFAHVTFGAAGAPTLDVAGSKGVVSVTHDGTGLYTFVFGTKAGMLDTYNRLLGVFVTFKGAGVFQEVSVKADAIATVGSSSIQLQFGNTPADPASGVEVLIDFQFKNSTAP